MTHGSQGSKLLWSRLSLFLISKSETETIDYEELERIAKEEKPQLIVAGASAYRVSDFKHISEITKVGAYFMVDTWLLITSLVAKGAHQNQFHTPML